MKISIFRNFPKSKGIEESIKLAIKFGITNEDLSPKHCYECGHDEFQHCNHQQTVVKHGRQRNYQPHRSDLHFCLIQC